MKRYRGPPFYGRAFSISMRFEVTIRFGRAQRASSIGRVAIWNHALAFRAAISVLKIAEEAVERWRHVALPAPISDCVKAAALGLQNPAQERQIGLAAH